MNITFYTAVPQASIRHEITMNGESRFASVGAAHRAAQAWIDRAVAAELPAAGFARLWNPRDPTAPKGAVERRVTMQSITTPFTPNEDGSVGSCTVQCRATFLGRSTLSQGVPFQEVLEERSLDLDISFLFPSQSINLVVDVEPGTVTNTTLRLHLERKV